MQRGFGSVVLIQSFLCERMACSRNIGAGHAAERMSGDEQSPQMKTLSPA